MTGKPDGPQTVYIYRADITRRREDMNFICF